MKKCTSFFIHLMEQFYQCVNTHCIYLSFPICYLLCPGMEPRTSRVPCTLEPLLPTKRFLFNTRSGSCATTYFPFRFEWEKRITIPHSSAICKYYDCSCHRNDVNQLALPAALTRSASPTYWRDTSLSAPRSSPTEPKVTSACQSCDGLSLSQTETCCMQYPVSLLEGLHYGWGSVDQKHVSITLYI